MVTNEISPEGKTDPACEDTGLTTLTAIIGFAVQVLRKQKGFTQAGLSADCGISQATISRIELGEADVTVPQLYALSKSLGIGVPELLAMTDSIRASLLKKDISVIDRLPKPSEEAKSSSTNDKIARMTPIMSLTSPMGFAIASVALAIIKNASKK